MQELQHRGVRDIATALAEAEKLVDFKREEKPKRECHTKGGGDHQRRKGDESTPRATDDERSDGESQKKRDNRDKGR